MPSIDRHACRHVATAAAERTAGTGRRLSPRASGLGDHHLGLLPLNDAPDSMLDYSIGRAMHSAWYRASTGIFIATWQPQPPNVPRGTGTSPVPVLRQYLDGQHRNLLSLNDAPDAMLDYPMGTATHPA